MQKLRSFFGYYGAVALVFAEEEIKTKLVVN